MNYEQAVTWISPNINSLPPSYREAFAIVKAQADEAAQLYQRVLELEAKLSQVKDRYDKMRAFYDADWNVCGEVATEFVELLGETLEGKP